MKKFSLSIALALLAGCLALSPTTANAQDEKQAEFERTWYDICYTKKDAEKCYQMSKELKEKYSKSQYLPNAEKNIKAYEQSKAWERFQAALKAYYTPPQDAAKLDQLFAAGEDYLKIDPGQQYVVGQMALAGANGAMGGFYKNPAKVKGHAETALKAFESSTPPEGWKPPEWEPLREIVQAQMNQFLGWQLHLSENKADQETALSYLTKATQIKGKEGAGWKDPNNYWLRAVIYSNQYSELRKPYDAMTDEQKVSDAGKEILKQVNDLLDTKLIPEYARVLVTATKPEAKGIYDAAKSQFDAFWKYRTDAPEKADAYVKNYAADPTIATVAIPVKVETAENSAAPTAPVAGAANVKLSAGGPAMAPSANGKGASNGNGAKATPAAKGSKGSKGGSKGKKRRG
ncbi:MAG: hypothetical protein JMDDDDMK_00831 [Acidobacteria bacterium]|nr:hypothetical protein [Acidobacteriota bacterium]